MCAVHNAEFTSGRADRQRSMCYEEQKHDLSVLEYIILLLRASNRRPRGACLEEPLWLGAEGWSDEGAFSALLKKIIPNIPLG